LSNFGYSQVKSWEGTIVIPTYRWEEDVNPKFWAMEGGAKGAATVRMPIVYPYTMQDHLSRTLENVTYKALYLENEYWYPVHGLGDGFEFANKRIAFRTVRKNEQMEIK
jgi:hypothetical protein